MAGAVVRLVRLDDLDGLVALLDDMDSMMTTMPADADAMAERLGQSLASLGPVSGPGDESYMFVLVEQGRILGLSMLYAAVGRRRPFYNYRVSQVSHYSPELGVRVDTRLLNMVNEYTGCTEFGTLYLHPDARGAGRGRLLSYARLLFIAAHRQRFAERLMAEIRGLVDERGKAPFWEALGARFMHTSFDEADLRSGNDHRFIADLMPRHPIYVNMLPDAARAAIAQPHPLSRPAAALLERSGFHYNGAVDIFDGGPCIECRAGDNLVIRRSRRQRLASGADGGERMLLANPDLQEFAAVASRASATGERLCAPASALQSLALGAGDEVLAWQ